MTAVPPSCDFTTATFVGRTVETNRIFEYKPPPHFRSKVVCKHWGEGGRGGGVLLGDMVHALPLIQHTMCSAEEMAVYMDSWGTLICHALSVYILCCSCFYCSLSPTILPLSKLQWSLCRPLTVIVVEFWALLSSCSPPLLECLIQLWLAL